MNVTIERKKPTDCNTTTLGKNINLSSSSGKVDVFYYGPPTSVTKIDVKQPLQPPQSSPQSHHNQHQHHQQQQSQLQLQQQQQHHHQQQLQLRQQHNINMLDTKYDHCSAGSSSSSGYGYQNHLDNNKKMLIQNVQQVQSLQRYYTTSGSSSCLKRKLPVSNNNSRVTTTSQQQTSTTANNTICNTTVTAAGIINAASSTNNNSTTSTFATTTATIMPTTTSITLPTTALCNPSPSNSMSSTIRHHLEFSRGLRPDVSLVPPIRQTASIFKQPVTVYKTQDSKVKNDLKHGITQEKPKQLFWEKRLEGLRACNMQTGTEFHSIDLPKSLLKPIGPNVNEQTLLQSVATALHVSSQPVTGQTASKQALLTNSGVYLNPDQPLMQLVTITDDDIRKQEDRVNLVRRKIQDVLKG